MAFSSRPMPDFNKRSCAYSLNSGSVSRSGGRVGLRNESQGVGVFFRRHPVEPPGTSPDEFGRACQAGLRSAAGQVPFGATKAKYVTGKSALRLTSPHQRSSMGITEGYAWARHGVSTYNPREEYKKPNLCGTFFLEASLVCPDANENGSSGTMLLQTPCDSVAASGQGSAA